MRGSPSSSISSADGDPGAQAQAPPSPVESPDSFPEFLPSGPFRKKAHVFTNQSVASEGRSAPSLSLSILGLVVHDSDCKIVLGKAANEQGSQLLF